MQALELALQNSREAGYNVYVAGLSRSGTKLHDSLSFLRSKGGPSCLHPRDLFICPEFFRDPGLPCVFEIAGRQKGQDDLFKENIVAFCAI